MGMGGGGLVELGGGGMWDVILGDFIFGPW